MSEGMDALAKSMIEMYGDAAESETRKYALKHKNAGKTVDYVLWTKIADVIARRKLARQLDA